MTIWSIAWRKEILCFRLVPSFIAQSSQAASTREPVSRLDPSGTFPSPTLTVHNVVDREIDSSDGGERLMPSILAHSAQSASSSASGSLVNPLGSRPSLLLPVHNVKDHEIVYGDGGNNLIPSIIAQSSEEASKRLPLSRSNPLGLIPSPVPPVHHSIDRKIEYAKGGEKLTPSVLVRSTHSASTSASGSPSNPSLIPVPLNRPSRQVSISMFDYFIGKIIFSGS
jgi:hypothetical protein